MADRRIRAVSTWVLTAGMLIMVLGVVHNVTTGLAYHEGLERVPLADARSFIYLFVGTGTVVSFTGLLVVYAAWGLRHTERWAFTAALVGGAIVALVGVVALVALSTGVLPSLFVLAGLAVLVPLLRHRRDLRRQHVR